MDVIAARMAFDARNEYDREIRERLLDIKRAEESSNIYHQILAYAEPDEVPHFDGFQEWRECCYSSQLLLSGPKGAGKTYTAGDVVHWLEKENCGMPESMKPIVCFYFYHRGNTESHKAKAIDFYSSLILQLLEQEQELNIPFQEFFSLDGSNINQRRMVSFLASEIPRLQREMFIVIDGIDGYDTPSQTHMICLLNEFIGQPLRLKILWTSRSGHCLKVPLDNCEEVEWTADPQRHERIIERMMSKSLKGVEADVRQQMLVKLKSEFSGDLSWVRRAIDLVEDKSLRKPKHISQAIDKMDEQRSCRWINFLHKIGLMSRFDKMED